MARDLYYGREEPMFTREAERQIEDNFKNTEEAWALLALIDAEFQSDPMSVQCFDLHVVQRVKECISKRKTFTETGPYLG